MLEACLCFKQAASHRLGNARYIDLKEGSWILIFDYAVPRVYFGHNHRTTLGVRTHSEGDSRIRLISETNILTTWDGLEVREHPAGGTHETQAEGFHAPVSRSQVVNHSFSTPLLLWVLRVDCRYPALLLR